VSSNPKPKDALGDFNAKRTEIIIDPHREVTSNLLEMQRGVTGILEQQGVLLIGQCLNLSRQFLVQRPEFWGGQVIQSLR
jgi:hypothetical protein